MKQSLLRIAAVIGAIMLLFSIVIGPGILAPPITLIFGWLPAVDRLFRAWHPGASGALLFGMTLLVLVAGAHRFLRWVYRGLHQKESSRRFAARVGPGTGTVPEPAAEDGCATSVSRWRWKWTLCGFGI